MDFGEQIKNIRQKEKLTQEQFAMKLNVSRQAVSNWAGMAMEIMKIMKEKTK